MRGGLRVVVTGMGAVSAIGHDCAALLDSVEHGVGGIAPIRRFDTGQFTVHTGAEVRGWAGEQNWEVAPSEAWLCIEFAFQAAREAINEARLNSRSFRPERMGLVFGTALGDLERPVHELGEELAARLGFEGPCLTACTACFSSTGAIGLGRDMVLDGRADVVLAGGADVLTAKVFAGFHALGVLSPDRCAPFSMPFGTSLGEGAGFLVLERDDVAAKRGIEPLVIVSGYGLSGDGYHETSPDPRGTGVERVMRAALTDAGIEPEDVGYVNAHGSGTEANDPSEWRGIQKGLERSAAVPVNSSKGAFGHAQGAAGALETIVTILMMRRGLLPPTLNFVGPRPLVPRDPIAGPRPRKARYDHAVCLNAAFGGANAAVVISRVPPARATSPERTPVGVLGLGMVSRFGIGTDSWEGREEIRDGSGRVPPFSFAEVNSRIDPHGLDPASRYLTAAAALALRDIGDKVTNRARRDAGLVMGSVGSSPESLSVFGRSVTERGLSRVSASAFARIVLNAPAGFCSKLLGLQGPMTALTVGAGSGLAVIVLAAEIVSSRSDTRLVLAAGVDELGEEENARFKMPAGEGAACVALGKLDEAGGPQTPPRITSWGIAGPGRLSDAIEQARMRAENADRDVDDVFDERQYAGCAEEGWALPSALAFVAAVSALRRNQIGRALVTSALGSSVSIAVLLDA